MRNYFSLLVFFIIVGCASTEAQQIAQKKLGANQDITIVTITIDGMACQAGCADKIQKNLEDLDGIRSAEVSYDQGEAVVTFIPAKTNADEIRKTITSTKVKDYIFTIIKNMNINTKTSE
ncbi:MAG: heavy metal-associated domain-containing protein [Maribacter sp.]|jgi:copper chaperone CopZ